MRDVYSGNRNARPHTRHCVVAPASLESLQIDLLSEISRFSVVFRIRIKYESSAHRNAGAAHSIALDGGSPRWLRRSVQYAKHGGLEWESQHRSRWKWRGVFSSLISTRVRLHVFVRSHLCEVPGATPRRPLEDCALRRVRGQGPGHLVSVVPVPSYAAWPHSRRS